MRDRIRSATAGAARRRQVDERADPRRLPLRRLSQPRHRLPDRGADRAARPRALRDDRRVVRARRRQRHPQAADARRSTDSSTCAPRATARSRRCWRRSRSTSPSISRATRGIRGPTSSRFRPAPIQVSWLGYPGTLGARLHRLHHRRRHGRAARARAVLCREDRAAAGLLPGQRSQARHRRARRRRAPRPGCRRPASCSAASTTASRSRPPCSTSGCGCCRRFPAACCGCCRTMPVPRPICGARPPRAASIRRGWSSPAAMPLDRSSRAPSPRRPVPRHAALQCPHDRERRAVGGPAGRDLPGQRLRRPRRGEPAQRGRPAGAGDAQPRRLRGAGAAARDRRGDAAALSATRLAPNRLSLPAVRHRPVSPPY